MGNSGVLHMWSSYSEIPEDFTSVGQKQYNKLDFYMRRGNFAALFKDSAKSISSAAVPCLITSIS